MQFFGIPILGKFSPKSENWQFKLKSGTKPKSDMQNSIVMWTFFVLDQKYSFWKNLVSKFKIVWSEIWYWDKFEYAEFIEYMQNMHIRFFCFRLEVLFLVNGASTKNFCHP